MSVDAPAVSSVSADRPADLVPLQTAARQVDRARSTIRGWIASGVLRSWREGVSPNAPLLVSLEELRVLATGGTLSATPPRPPPTPTAVQERQTQELAALQERLREAERVAVEVELLRQVASDLRGSVQDLRQALERERVRADSAEAEVQTLRVTHQLPWWRRLLPG